MELHCGRYRLTFQRPLIMGIVNVTADSFSGDGRAPRIWDSVIGPSSIG